MKNLLAMVVICLAASLAQASALASYNFNSGYAASSYDSLHLQSVGSLTFNPAFSGVESRPLRSAGNNCVQGSGFETTTAHDGSYWSVTFTVVTGYSLALSDIDLDIIKNGSSSPTEMDLAYVSDGTTYSLGSWTPLTTSWVTYTKNSGLPASLIGTVTFEFIPVLAGGTTQTLEIDNLTFNGTVNVINTPEPASLSLLGLGLFGLFIRRKRK